ncbi:DUF5368 domain-containing protein [Pusillimonas sp.]|uniref:DUF5368 domain-containing protein n=1 Tax=Pusillimonas sp. TaxID=3040095 RepID=UPI0037C9E9C1
MKELDLFVLLAVFHEMLGALLWVLLFAAVFSIAALAVLLLRERRIDARRLLRSQAIGLLGGAGALVLMVRVSSSGFMDVGGPIDWLLIALVFGIGLIGVTVAFYTLGGWWALLRHTAK